MAFLTREQQKKLNERINTRLMDEMVTAIKGHIASKKKPILDYTSIEHIGLKPTARWMNGTASMVKMLGMREVREMYEQINGHKKYKAFRDTIKDEESGKWSRDHPSER